MYKKNKLMFFKQLERRIALIYLHPLITSSIFLSAFKKAKAIVLETYGMGNFPISRVDLIEIIEDAILKYNKAVVIVSQWRKGFVRSSYASSVVLARIGAILAEDMTIEWVIAKLSYVLGKGYKGKEVKEQMLKDLRGEITSEKNLLGIEEDSSKASKLLGKLNDKLEDSSTEELNTIAKMIQPVIAQTASTEGNINRLRKLIEEGYDINEQLRNGKTPLHVAAMQNDHLLAEFLINLESINLHVIDNSGNSPLYYAWYNGNQTIAGMLILKDALFQANEGKLADTLWQKAKAGDLISIKMFAKAGANLEISNYDSRTLAHVAAAEGNQVILEYLAKNTKFNFDIKDRYGRTPIDDIQDEWLKQTIRQYYISNKSQSPK